MFSDVLYKPSASHLAQIQDQLKDMCAKKNGGRYPDMGMMFNQEFRGGGTYRISMVGAYSSNRFVDMASYRVSVEKSGRGVAEEELKKWSQYHPVEKAAMYSEEYQDTGYSSARYVRRYVTNPRVANAIKTWRTQAETIRRCAPPWDEVPGVDLDWWAKWCYSRLSNPHME